MLFLFCSGWDEATSLSTWLEDSDGVAALAVFIRKKGKNAPRISI